MLSLQQHRLHVPGHAAGVEPELEDVARLGLGRKLELWMTRAAIQPARMHLGDRVRPTASPENQGGHPPAGEIRPAGHRFIESFNVHGEGLTGE